MYIKTKLSHRENIMAEELCRSAGESSWWYSSTDASSSLSYKESYSAPPPACDISILPREEAYDAIKLQQFFHRPQFSTFNWTAHDQPFLLNGWRSGENGGLVHGAMLQMEDHHASTAVRDIFPFEQHRICNEFGSMERIKAQPQYCAFGTPDDDQVAIQLPPVPLMHVPSSWNSLSQLLKSTTLMAQRQHESSFNNQLQFGRNTTTTTSPFWNASFIMEPKPILRNPTATINSGGDRESCSSSTQKTESKPAVKKPRIGTPSPLPTFKVRKEKLGDRITALQQLVSPFGKTDTASVLQEAFEYIKFLHDQVLSSPYLKSSNGHSTQQTKMISDMYNSSKGDEGKRVVLDLRSRGLCLVPIASTFPVVSETASPDFWHPALLGATFR
ncbi:transcription factor bHLH112-like isoform X2 [Zingiber officinale]|uniref:transcription factor bHLH112-like isoform X2 n=1 Tax=Zingiber officinale TaxID=94328 RepID=UPI001C4D3C7C|nr:transcription factor bHLH112-like isoform X2 [Zingiber officinale]